MPKSEVVVLSHEGKNDGGQVSLEGNSRNDSFVNGFVAGEYHSDRHFQPGTLRTLPRMVKAGQLGRLRNAFKTRVRDKLYQSNPLKPTCVFARKAVEGVLDKSDRVCRQFPLNLVLDLDGHYEFLRKRWD